MVGLLVLVFLKRLGVYRHPRKGRAYLGRPTLATVWVLILGGDGRFPLLLIGLTASIWHFRLAVPFLTHAYTV